MIKTEQCLQWQTYRKSYMVCFDMGHLRLLEMAPFDRMHKHSYSSSIVTMAVAISCIVCKRINNHDFS